MDKLKHVDLSDFVGAEVIVYFRDSEIPLECTLLEVNHTFTRVKFIKTYDGFERPREVVVMYKNIDISSVSVVRFDGKIE